MFFTFCNPYIFNQLTELVPAKTPLELIFGGTNTVIWERNKWENILRLQSVKISDLSEEEENTD